MEVAFTADGVGDVLLEPSGILFHRHEDDLVVGGGEPLRHDAAVGLAGLRLLGPCAVDVRGDVGDALLAGADRPRVHEDLAGIVQDVFQGLDG